MNNNIPTLFYLCGLPASGKSTYADKLTKEYENTVLISSDAVRKKLWGDETNQRDPNQVFGYMKNRTKKNLKDGVNVVYDATNVKANRRVHFLQCLGRKLEYKKICIIMATPYDECVLRNQERDRVVPEHVIENMYKQWDTPHEYEGWDDIWVIRGDVRHLKNVHRNFINRYMDYWQDNDFHSMTLSNHCLATANFLCNKHGLDEDSPLYWAGLLHDCGKPFTKSFVNTRGETTNLAHYYSHEHCGAYDALTYDYGKNIFPADVSALINYHMHPYFWESNGEKAYEKSCNKYRKRWGDELFNDIMKLHKADKAAH